MLSLVYKFEINPLRGLKQRFGSRSDSTSPLCTCRLILQQAAASNIHSGTSNPEGLHIFQLHRATAGPASPAWHAPSPCGRSRDASG